VDLLTVLSTCSLAKDFGLVLAMAMTYSQGEPYTVRGAAAVGDVPLEDAALNSDEEPTRTRETARADMRRFKHPVVGLLPVPVAWAARYQHAPEDLLDACTGVSIATAQLSEFERACAGRGRSTRQCALHAYVEAADIPLFELAVLDALRGQHFAEGASAVEVVTDEILGAGLFVSDAPVERVGAADRVLVSVEPPAQKKSEPVRKNNKPNERR
jgi:hypothetical protein